MAEVTYRVTITVHEVLWTNGIAQVVGDLELEGTVGAVYETDSPVEAARVARFLGGTALRLPPVDTEMLIDEEIAEVF